MTDSDNYEGPLGGEEPDSGGDGGDDWLTTFADLSMLLMTFFVLLFSMSTLDTAKFADSFQSVKKALGAKGKELMSAPVTAKEVSVLVEQAKLKQQIIKEQKRVYSDFRSYVSTKGVQGVVAATLESGKITINIPSDVLFKKDEVELSEKGRNILKTLYDFLIKSPDQRINIRGFTDNTPPAPDSRFRDNWEISALRAVNVLRRLVKLGLPQNRLTATGLADLEPLYPNTTKANRAKNQRVEFVLERRIGE